jgi:hypothetical protein
LLELEESDGDPHATGRSFHIQPFIHPNHPIGKGNDLINWDLETSRRSDMGTREREKDLLGGKVFAEERYCNRNLKILLKMSVAIAGQPELIFSTVVSSGHM